jgi:glycosyltransferase involved in cell wall biosynthesis
MRPKILLVHNFYRLRGGEDQVVDNEIRLLQKQGHAVEPLFFHSTEIKNASRLQTALDLPFSKNAAARFLALANSFQPDIVHVHNFFPLATTSIHRAAFQLKIPLVQTLHNFRLTCINGLLFREGQSCQRCVGNFGAAGILHACYQNSFLGSLALTRMNRRNQAVWPKMVSRYIALSNFARDIFIRAGIPADKISIKPNFSSLQTPNSLTSEKPPSHKPYAIYLGRLSEEKGPHKLLESWSKQSSIPIKIVGDGPLLVTLREKYKLCPNVDFTGSVPWENAMSLLENARFVVIPSLCYENFPTVISEAMLRSIPILASNIGSIPEILDFGAYGTLYDPMNEVALLKQAQYLWQDTDDTRAKTELARQYAQRSFSESNNYSILNRIYSEILKL